MLRLNKRGLSVILYFRLMGLVVGITVLILLVKFGNDVIGDTLLEKNYESRELGLTLTSIYAAPGDVTYAYELDGRRAGKFDYKVGEGKVHVSDKNGELVYYYQRPPGMPDVSFEAEDVKSIIITKQGSSITLEESS